MKEVLVTFENEGLEGIIAVETYLMDAAKRMGVAVDDGCRQGEEEHRCVMRVGIGKDLLSEPTKVELDQLTENRIGQGDRLACQARIDKAGELKIMSVQKTKEAEKREEEPQPGEEFRKEFETMPLDKKFASLVELEAIALGETFSYVINSPYEAAGKAMEFLAGFGWKMDRADQEAKKPEEHSESNGNESAESEDSKTPEGEEK
ncbi:MAG: (2Fe-2S)-binding protein [Acidobacteria bacterium]|nr:MAG: (2Fe-2S)-binding protein [Acidobacteriota bacterium]REK01789.1 MAG: (2Fe-2S)-binding protein [Acidobacteriota bacterium]REK14745.1 MAG: (2Fe-2S)-binding protein [Acidobacteriota bacterium]REK45460.1 MAG: (2Fe-2S)-binding protein [Acidobacteriota bacterium]